MGRVSPPVYLDCPYRVAVEAAGNPAGCVQCETELRPEEDHFHILYESSILAMCGECWSRGPLPEDGSDVGRKNRCLMTQGACSGPLPSTETAGNNAMPDSTKADTNVWPPDQHWT